MKVNFLGYHVNWGYPRLSKTDLAQNWPGQKLISPKNDPNPTWYKTDLVNNWPVPKLTQSRSDPKLTWPKTDLNLNWPGQKLIWWKTDLSQNWPKTDMFQNWPSSKLTCPETDLVENRLCLKSDNRPRKTNFSYDKDILSLLWGVHTGTYISIQRPFYNDRVHVITWKSTFHSTLSRERCTYRYFHIILSILNLEISAVRVLDIRIDFRLNS